jgi:hypothetical protein
MGALAGKWLRAPEHSPTPPDGITVLGAALEGLMVPGVGGSSASSSFLDALKASAVPLVRVGRASVRDAATARYGANIPASDFDRRLQTKVRLSISVDLDAQGRLRRFNTVANEADLSPPGATRSTRGKVALTVEIYDLGVALHIVAPPVLDSATLGRLMCPPGRTGFPCT